MATMGEVFLGVIPYVEEKELKKVKDKIEKGTSPKKGGGWKSFLNTASAIGNMLEGIQTIMQGLQAMIKRAEKVTKDMLDTTSQIGKIQRVAMKTGNTQKAIEKEVQTMGNQYGLSTEDSLNILESLEGNRDKIVNFASNKWGINGKNFTPSSLNVLDMVKKIERKYATMLTNNIGDSKNTLNIKKEAFSALSNILGNEELAQKFMNGIIYRNDIQAQDPSKPNKKSLNTNLTPAEKHYQEYMFATGGMLSNEEAVRRNAITGTTDALVETERLKEQNITGARTPEGAESIAKMGRTGQKISNGVDRMVDLLINIAQLLETSDRDRRRAFELGLGTTDLGKTDKA